MQRKYRYPQTLQLVHGAHEDIRIDLSDMQGADNAARHARLKDWLKKPGARFYLEFTRAGDTPAQSLHAIAAQGAIDADGAGEIVAHWRAVDLPHGAYDMWVKVNAEPDNFCYIRRDRLEII